MGGGGGEEGDPYLYLFYGFTGANVWNSIDEEMKKLTKPMFNKKLKPVYS